MSEKDKKIDFEKESVEVAQASYEAELQVICEPGEQEKDITVEDVEITNQGRLLNVSVGLVNLASEKNVNVGILVYEAQQTTEAAIMQEDILIGFRALTASVGADQTTLTVGPVSFVLPEDNLNTERDLIVRVVAHYTAQSQ